MKKDHVIYLLKINGVPYVGQTSAYHSRKSQHARSLKNNNHYNLHLQNAYNKHGANSLKWSILERCSIEDADCCERKWVSVYDSYHNGFNQTEGGERTYGTLCVWNGVEYPSINAAADAVGVDGMTMKYRLEQGYTCDDGMPGRGSSAAIAIKWNGVEYDSVSAAAKAAGISVSRMSVYLSKGYTCSEDC